MGRARFSLRTMLVATAVLAVGFAVFGVIISGLLSIVLLIIAIGPFSSRWQTWELAATIGWLLGALLAFSNAAVGGFTLFGLYFVGFVLVSNWVLRVFDEWMMPPSKIEWRSLFFVPIALLMVSILVKSDLDLRLRLALSEPALRAEVRQIGSGHNDTFNGRAHRVGLFWAVHVEENQGCIFWETGGP